MLFKLIPSLYKSTFRDIFTALVGIWAHASKRRVLILQLPHFTVCFTVRVQQVLACYRSKIHTGKCRKTAMTYFSLGVSTVSRHRTPFTVNKCWQLVSSW